MQLSHFSKWIYLFYTPLFIDTEKIVSFLLETINFCHYEKKKTSVDRDFVGIFSLLHVTCNYEQCHVY